MSKATTEQWIIRPDYGQANAYYLWNAAGNFHDDAGPAAMDRRAALMAAAPDLLAALESADKDMADAWRCLNPRDNESLTIRANSTIRAALNRVRRKAATP